MDIASSQENPFFTLDDAGLLAEQPGMRKAVIAHVQLANAGLSKESLLHAVGIDPAQPYSEHPLKDREATVFVQPPLAGVQGAERVNE